MRQDATGSVARRRVLGALAALGAGVAHPRLAAAQESWPDRRVRLINPAAPGSSGDVLSRLLSERLESRWRQPVVVENRPGGEGVPAMEAMMAARPGEALLLANHGVLTVTPILQPRLGFDPLVEFAPVAALATDGFGLVAPATLPAADLPGLVALARARPGALNYTAAMGPPSLAMRDFLRATGIEMEFIAFRGLGPAIVAELMAERLHLLLAPLAPMIGAVREGKVRLIATTGARRAAAAPAVPTSAEQGFPGLQQEGIHGLLGWKGMPDALRDRLAAEARSAVAEPATAERLLAFGLEPRAEGPAEFAATLAAQRERWARLAREFGTAPA